MRLPKGMTIKSIQDNTIVTLYDTNIVSVFDNDKIKLDTGGWFTRHTKNCMNLVLSEYGFSVRQEKGNWFVLSGNDKYEYKDGMILTVNS